MSVISPAATSRLALHLPWDSSTPDEFKLPDAGKVLDEDHAGTEARSGALFALPLFSGVCLTLFFWPELHPLVDFCQGKFAVYFS
mgnify:CR=1 FL=1